MHDDLNLAMGNLVNYFNQFQKYYVSDDSNRLHYLSFITNFNYFFPQCNYLEEQVSAAKQL